MKYQAPRGTHDILPEETPRWRYVEETFRHICALHGYQEIRTPIFEHTELFVRGVGQHTDIVSKEMYTFTPREGDDAESLTLRPEGTAGVMRAYLEHSLGAKAPLNKLYYIGPNFRYERPQAGRYRQHHQCGIEALGSQDPALDVEVIGLGMRYLRALGIRGAVLELNSIGCPVCRPAYREAIRDAVRPVLDRLCEDCRRRYEFNPLRIPDCKNEDWQRLGVTLPDPVDTLCEECATHFAAVQEGLTAQGIPFQRNPRLVRGFDYATKTTFEITHSALGAQSTLLGGVRYDGLIAELGGEPTPGIGFGSGIERVLLTLAALGVELPVERVRPVFVATLGETARMPGLQLLARLRDADIAADTDYLGRSLKAQLKQANRLDARFAVILGEDEVKAGTATLRDMETSTQEPVPLTEVVPRLQAALRSEVRGN
jgi:histidyl-tRNA synthetase